MTNCARREEPSKKRKSEFTAPPPSHSREAPPREAGSHGPEARHREDTGHRLPQGGVRTRRGAPSRVERRRIPERGADSLETNPRPPTPTRPLRVQQDSFLLVDTLVAEWDARLANAPPRCALEVGSGTGYVIASAAVLMRDTGVNDFRCHATDVNPDAVACTRATADAHGVGDRVSVIRCDLLGPLRESLRGKVYHPPVDAEGYAYAFSMCDVLSKPDLPSGCQQYAERPSVVKYKTDNPADCIEIGSIGPCSQGECGMTGTAQPNGVQITYTYTYGCQNTFTLDITSGTDSEPGQINSDECSYSGQWEAKDFSFDNYRCEHDRCVKSGRHLQGLAKEECEAVCGEPPRCVKELIRLCGETADESSCEFCAGSHDIALGLAGCKHDEIHAFCASNGR